MEKRSSNRIFGGKFAAAAVAILGLCVAGTLTFLGANSAQAVNVSENAKNCSITMNMPDPSKPGFSNYDSMPEPLPTGLKYDLYKVAKAVEVSGHDVYSFEKLDPFAGTSTDLTKPTASDYDALAQEALSLVKDSDNAKVVGTAGVNKAASGLDAGMYLVVVHGDDPSGKSNYIVERSFTDASTKETSTKLVSIANSDTYEFSFLPQLIAVPSHLYDGKNSTDNAGDWQYDVISTLKPTWNPRYGSLKIVKDLLTYDKSGKPATFVFEVEGRIGNKVVYSNVVDITFNGATSNSSATLDGIQAGATVTVKEVYTGATYELTSPATQNATIKADDVVQVNFENDHNESGNNGGSVSNRFGYTSGDTAADSQWNLKQIIDGEEQQ